MDRRILEEIRSEVIEALDRVFGRAFDRAGVSDELAVYSRLEFLLWVETVDDEVSQLMERFSYVLSLFNQRRRKMFAEEVLAYPPMDEERTRFLDYVIRMYAAQESDPRFDATGEILVDLPGLPHFIVRKHVYSPEHVNVSMAWPEYIATRTEGKSFLDMGTGTGIAAIYVARYGKPSRVAAADISAMAVENCKANALQYGLQEPFFRVYEGDVYSGMPVEERFDVMFWNFPWNAPDKSIEEVLEERGVPVTPERVTQLYAGLDRRYTGLRIFMKEGWRRLKPGGEMFLGAGSASRHDIICGEARRYGYRIEVVAEKEMVMENIEHTTSSVMLYRLSISL